MPRGRLNILLEELTEKKPDYVLTLHLPYHPRLVYLLNDTRKTKKTTLSAIVEFLCKLPVGYPRLRNMEYNIEEVEK